MKNFYEIDFGKEEFYSLNALNRMHWGERYRIKQRLQATTFYLAKHAKIPHLKQIEVELVVGNVTRRMDPDNYAWNYKPILDGLKLARVINDDSYKEVKIGSPIFSVVMKRSKLRIRSGPWWQKILDEAYSKTDTW